jgi:hypothetical protein
MSPKDRPRKPSVLSELPTGRPQLRSERRGEAKAKPAPTPPPKAEADQPFVTTALQAAGELAQIGIAVGARALRNALDRLPKP